MWCADPPSPAAPAPRQTRRSPATERPKPFLAAGSLSRRGALFAARTRSERQLSGVAVAPTKGKSQRAGERGRRGSRSRFSSPLARPPSREWRPIGAESLGSPRCGSSQGVVGLGGVAR